MTDFKVGDVVRANGQKQKMIIDEIYDDRNKVHCFFHKDGKRVGSTYEKSLLKKVWLCNIFKRRHKKAPDIY